MKTLLKNRLRILSSHFAIIPSLPVTQKKGIYVGDEERGPHPSWERHGTIYRLVVPVLSFHVVVVKDGKEKAEKAWCTCTVVVLLIKPIALLRYHFRCRGFERSLVSLQNRSGKEGGKQTLCDKRDNNFVWNNFTFLKQMFLQRPENINAKWGSRHNTQVIALSLLSHSSVLPSSSFCRPVA